MEQLRHRLWRQNSTNAEALLACRMSACVCGGPSGYKPASKYIKYYYQHYCSSLNNLARRHDATATRQANVEQAAYTYTMCVCVSASLPTPGMYAAR